MKDKKEIAQVGTSAANHDPVIGDLIAEAMEQVGKDGVITVEEGHTAETTLEVVEGMQFDRGYVSPYFVTDAERMEAVLDNPYILLHEKKLSHMKELLPVLEQIAQAGAPLLIIAEDVEGEALATLVVNKLRGTLQCAAVKAPGFGERRKEMLQDIAVLTRGQVISEDLGMKLENVTLNDLGRAKRVTITKEATTIVEGAGAPADIEGRVKHLRTQIEETTSEYDRENLNERLAKLVGGVAVIKVGAATEAALKEKKARLEDALNATRAAVEEGVVPGGGLAYIRALPALEQLQLEGDRQVGVNIIKRALEEPMRQIALNAGVEGATVVQRVKAASDMIGYDAAADAYVDLMDAGVLDPTKVSRTALQHAASVVGLLLTTEVLIAEASEAPTAHHDGMGSSQGEHGLLRGEGRSHQRGRGGAGGVRTAWPAVRHVPRGCEGREESWPWHRGKSVSDPRRAQCSSCSTPMIRSKRSIARNVRRRMTTFASAIKNCLWRSAHKSAAEIEQAIRHYTHMRCPQCGEPLEDTPSPGVTMAACPGCGGIWLDKGAWEGRVGPKAHGWLQRFFAGLMASNHAQVLMVMDPPLQAFGMQRAHVRTSRKRHHEQAFLGHASPRKLYARARHRSPGPSIARADRSRCPAVRTRVGSAHSRCAHHRLSHHPHDPEGPRDILRQGRHPVRTPAGVDAPAEDGAERWLSHRTEPVRDRRRAEGTSPST